MRDMKREAKMKMLQALKDEMSKLMSEDVKGLKKVTVAAPDEAGLKMGLEKAEDILEEKEEMKKDEDMEEDKEESMMCPHCGKEI